jgi:hypothetical protein
MSHHPSPSNNSLTHRFISAELQLPTFYKRQRRMPASVVVQAISQEAAELKKSRSFTKRDDWLYTGTFKFWNDLNNIMMSVGSVCCVFLY